MILITAAEGREREKKLEKSETNQNQTKSKKNIISKQKNDNNEATGKQRNAFISFEIETFERKMQITVWKMGRKLKWIAST